MAETFLSWGSYIHSRITGKKSKYPGRNLKMNHWICSITQLPLRRAFSRGRWFSLILISIGFYLTAMFMTALSSPPPPPPPPPPVPEIVIPPKVLEEKNFSLPGPPLLCPEFNAVQDKTTRITFLETSGETCITPRSACGVESAARANPDMQIYVYFNSRKPTRLQKQYISEKPGKIRSCQVTEALKRFPNVQFIEEDLLLNHLKGSPLWKLYEKGTLNQSEWSFVHLSDALRPVVLNKYGGFFLDFDVIVVRPLHCLRNTFSYTPDVEHIENGVQVFDKGHPFLKFFMKYATAVYNPEVRMAIGPPTLATAFKLFCNQTGLKKGKYNCYKDTEIILSDPDAFYPLPHFDFWKFYTPTYDQFDLSNMSKSFLTHIYLSGWGKNVSSTSLYASLARRYCPTVWQETKNANVKFGF